jgi:hypothetical protein
MFFSLYEFIKAHKRKNNSLPCKPKSKFLKIVPVTLIITTIYNNLT